MLVIFEQNDICFSVTMQFLYKLKTSRLFDKTLCKEPGPDDDPFSIQLMSLCSESRLLAVCGFSHVIVFNFSKQESNKECPVSFIKLHLKYLKYSPTSSCNLLSLQFINNFTYYSC